MVNRLKEQVSQFLEKPGVKRMGRAVGATAVTAFVLGEANAVIGYGYRLTDKIIALGGFLVIGKNLTIGVFEIGRHPYDESKSFRDNFHDYLGFDVMDNGQDAFSEQVTDSEEQA